MFDRLKFIVIKVSTYCNLQCKYCYETHASKEKAIKFNLYKELVSFLNKMPLDENFEISISGGEPSLCIDEFREAYRQLRKIMRTKDIKLRLDTISNGTNIDGIIGLLDDDIIKPWNCNISWDGLHSASKSRLVKNKKYDDEFFNNIIRKLGKQKYDYRKHITIRTSATADTIDELFDSYKFVTDCGCKRWDYYIINDEKNFNDPTYLNKIEEQLRKIYTYARDNGLANDLVNLENMIYLYFNIDDQKSRERHIVCRHLGEALMINADGSIYPCTMGDSTSRFFTGIKFGDIFTGLDKKVMQDFADDYNQPPSCGLMYKGEPCEALHCFECMMTCKYCNGSLQKKMMTQCDLRNIELRLFKEIFLDTGFKFEDSLVEKYKYIYKDFLDYNPVLNPNLPFKENKNNDNT